MKISTEFNLSFQIMKNDILMLRVLVDEKEERHVRTANPVPLSLMLLLPAFGLMTFLLSCSFEAQSVNAQPPNHLEQQQFKKATLLHAEDYSSNVKGKEHQWRLVEEETAYNGKAMQVLPDGGETLKKSEYLEKSPRLDYKVQFEEKGPYYIWIRGKGNRGSQSVHVGLNGEPVMTGEAIGTSGDQYSWSNRRKIPAGTRALVKVPSKGEQTVNVWMREDGFVLDEIFLTSSSVGIVTDEAGFQDFSFEPGPEDKTYDVVVYGGTPGGIMASISAARQGASVLLLEDTRHLGGIYVNGINHQEDQKKDPLTNMEKEFFGSRLGKFGAEGNVQRRKWAPHMAERAFNEMVYDEDIFVRFGERVEEVTKSGGWIEKIVMTDGSTIKGKTFIDASYFGDLMARSGVSFTTGRESKSKYGESLAGIQKGKTRTVDGTVLNEHGNLLQRISGWAREFEEGEESPKLMANNLRLTVTKADRNKVPFPKPPDYDPDNYELLLRDAKHNLHNTLDDIIAVYEKYGVHQNSEFNNPNDPIYGFSSLNNGETLATADYETRDRMIQEEVHYALGLLYFLQHHSEVPEPLQENAREWGLAADEYADHQHLPYEIYVREARRMVGRYVMTQSDIEEDRHKPDTISAGFWPFDSHHVQLLAVDENKYMIEGRFMEHIPRSYEIPYRSITPKKKKCRNLLVPVTMSSSRVAMTSLRLEPTWMPAGVASGVAAKLSIEQQKPVQEIAVSILQERLQDLDHNIHTLGGEDRSSPNSFDLISPQEGEEMSNRRPEFRWNASSDPDTGIARYEVFINGSFRKLVRDGADRAYRPSNPLSPGEHTWHVVAFNGHGLSVRSSKSTFDIKE